LDIIPLVRFESFWATAKGQRTKEKKKMMRKFAPLALCGLILLTTPGCDSPLIPPTDPVKLNEWIAKNKTSIIDVVKMGAELGTEKGLKAWAKKNPAGAKEASLALTQNINEQLLPYFKDGTKMLTAAEVKQFMASSLFNKVPDEVKLAIIAASAVLDFYLPVPSSTSCLTQDQRDIICAFLEGVRNGCDDFNAPTDPTATKTRKFGGKNRELPKGAWLE